MKDVEDYFLGTVPFVLTLIGLLFSAGIAMLMLELTREVLKNQCWPACDRAVCSANTDANGRYFCER
ncbi:MAG: hypothetical protein E6Q97_31655 [Desulfurellales bacterium]|nr:MAG: hypothetical protein E6Q97_31655 [Desulfurellales bacterium]